MKRQAIAPTIISAILLLGGISACTQANSSDTPQASSQPTTALASSTPLASSQASSTANTSSDQSKPNSKEREQAREARHKQIEEVLTPAQSQQLQDKLKQGEKLRKAISSLDLTTEQKTKIQAIFEKSYEQTPTPEKSPQ